MPGLEDEFGDVVKKARSGLGLTQAELGARAGLSEADVRAIEAYTLRPDEAHVRRLAAILGLRPDQLWALAQDSWSAPDVPWTIGDAYAVERLTNRYPEHCYVVVAPSGECLIVDPGDEAERVVHTASAGGRTAVAILITHAHRDHTGAVVPVQRATDAPVFVHQADVQGVAGVPTASVKTFAGDGEVRAGSFTIRLLHTPGHTAGSATYVLAAGRHTAAFCGDTLFAGSAGNARHSYEAILASLRQKIGRLPPETVLYPGHGPATTLAHELAWNPFL
jgi:glyoxylase-like metal-dependent hydrolase (beta-lactamase superfamily II)